MIRWRLRGHRSGDEPGGDEEQFIEIDASELHGIFAAPNWLRDVGLTAWLLVGVTLLLVGAVWLLSLTDTIVTPVITAAVIASVASPLVGWISRRGLPRWAAATVLMLGLVLVGVGVVLVVVGGITAETSSIQGHLSEAKDSITGWVHDLGVDPEKARSATSDASSSTTDTISALLNGITSGIETLSSLVFFLALTILSLFFLLSDGPRIRRWAEGHVGLPSDVSRTISTRVLQSLRGYFLGVTIVAAFNAVVVALGALILGVPLIGTLAAVTFLAAYVPYLGAWTAGAFSVLIALGGAGTDAAIGMIVVQLLANGILQQLVQPFAMGAALGIHPLAVLIVTIAGGALFGAVGLILAAPVTAAAVRIAADLGRARAEGGVEKPGVPAPQPSG
jgi:predicted PurR-regulated permease PerM